MSDVVLSVEGLSKRYRIGLKQGRADTLAGAFTSWAKSPLTNYRRLRSLSRFEDGAGGDDVIWALRDVTFDVARGEVVGIVGRNGAGKSTLLKILSRITDPSAGRVVLDGRVSSLLEVGTGFHPELTGRENVYLNGTILGMTKVEVDRKFDEIVDFSGVGKFIDTPVKRYSSGMQVRLAFSVAAHLEPEILLVDEVLAVGDAEFRRKCIGKMGEVAGEGRTVVFVSHNMGSLRRLCTRAICLSNGEVVDRGDTASVIRRYLDNSASHDAVVELPHERHRIRSPIQVRTIELSAADDRPTTSFLYGESIQIRLGVEVKESIDDLQVGIGIHTEGNRIATVHMPPMRCTADSGLLFVLCTIPGRTLLPGFYDLHLGARLGLSKRGLDWVPDAVSFQVSTASDDAAMEEDIDKGYVRLPVAWKVERGNRQPEAR